MPVKNKETSNTKQMKKNKLILRHIKTLEFVPYKNVKHGAVGRTRTSDHRVSTWNYYQLTARRSAN